MNGATARILLRYAVGFLAAKGFMGSDMAAAMSVDPDLIGIVEAGVSAAFVLALEGWYVVAKSLGWKL